jgi:hypothetical protein
MALSFTVLHNKVSITETSLHVGDFQSSDSKTLGSDDLHTEAGDNSLFNQHTPRLKDIDFMHL